MIIRVLGGLQGVDNQLLPTDDRVNERDLCKIQLIVTFAVMRTRSENIIGQCESPETGRKLKSSPSKRVLHRYFFDSIRAQPEMMYP